MSPASFERPRAYKKAPDAFTVANVTTGGPAAMAGLQVGDEVIAIDGEPATRLSGLDLRRVFRQPAGTRQALTYVGDGREETATLMQRELLP